MEKAGSLVGINSIRYYLVESRRRKLDCSNLAFLCFVLWLLSQIDNARLQVVDLIGTTLRLSSLDLAISYVFKGEKSASVAATSKVQGEILAPALTNAKVSVMLYSLSIGLTGDMLVIYMRSEI